MKYETIFSNALMAELVDARDLKSLGQCGCAGSIPARGTMKDILKCSQSVIKLLRKLTFYFKLLIINFKMRDI